jgi:serine/threonine-protein kinase
VHAAPLPDNLGDFAVEHELGRGGSGVVYAARWGAREVALKVLREDETATAKERERFLAEARNLAKVTHPGVVRVLAVGELPDGRPYLAMERLRGATLAERLMMQRVSPEHALVLFEQLASAVGALHAAGLVHRDIKPENIMLVKDGGVERIVLLDFGIARGVDDLPSTTTQAGLQRGTPAYMAPERFFGARATVSSDVYETAVVLYVMLTRALPWADPRNAKERMSPRPPSALGVRLPPALEEALVKALDPEPLHRPGTIDALVASVRGAAWEGETQLAPPAPTTVKIAGVRKAVVAVGTVAAFAAAVVVAVVMTKPEERKQAPADHPERASEASESKGAAPAVVTPIPPDAAPAADAAPVAVADAAPAPKPKKKKAQKTGSGTGTGTGTCQKIAALYCTDEFKETEGGMAGALCKAMTKNVDDWAKLPGDAAAHQEQWCRDSYDQMAAAVAERLRMWREGTAPGQR